MANKIDKARYHQIKRIAVNTIQGLGSYSETAVIACMMVIAHESYMGTMPEQIISFDSLKDREYKSTYDYARGIGGLEEFTHNDLWEESDNIRIDYLNTFGHHYNTKHCNVERCTYDMKYAIFMIRKKLHMIKEVIPSDLKEMSAYISKYYNAGGKGSAKDYYSDYLKWSK